MKPLCDQRFGFNSKLVRLKVLQVDFNLPNGIGFQFQTGSIKSLPPQAIGQGAD